MSVILYQIDSFTSVPFSGNPAGVCLLEGRVEADWMQHVAAEMNLSETAFVYPLSEGWSLRWFTPKVEVKLCGHATLAAAHALWESGWLDQDHPANFYTQSGLLTATRREDGIELDFPAQPVTAQEGSVDELENILGAKVLSVWFADWTYLVELENEAAVRELQPDFAAMPASPWGSLIVTSRPETNEFDFVSRFFGPVVGINEDPVTGSAHCVLGPFWGPRLGKTKLVGHQVSSRGGVVGVELAGVRVKISGPAVTVFKGQLLA